MDARITTDPAEDAYSRSLDTIDVSDPRLYYTDTWYPYFERLRREDPVHYTPESPYGPYWAITKYKDIVKVEVNHRVFRRLTMSGASGSTTRPRGWSAQVSYVWIRPSMTSSARWSVRLSTR